MEGCLAVVPAVLDLCGGEQPSDCPMCQLPQPCDSPLRVGLVVFVAFMLNHAVPPDADVGP